MANYDFIVETGTIVPDTSSTKKQVIEDLKQIKGFENMDYSDETPQGGIANAITLVRDDIARNNAYIANMFNPNYAVGAFLDAIGSLTATERFKATYTMVYGVELRGVRNTYVPNTLTVKNNNEDEFKIVGATTIGLDGIVLADFQAVKSGDIPCLANELDTDSTGVLGLESITNPNAGVIGENSENDVRFRRRREQTLAIQGTGTTEAIISGFYALPSIRSINFKENPTDQPTVEDGINLIANSIWVCVDGGNDEEIAKVFASKKDIGCAMNGEIEYAYLDPFSQQEVTYKFDRAIEKDILLKVYVKNNNTSPQTLIPYTCEQWALGNLTADEGLTVGRSSSPFEISASINEVDKGLTVLNIEHSFDGTNWQGGNININANEVGRLVASSVTVVIV